MKEIKFRAYDRKFGKMYSVLSVIFKPKFLVSYSEIDITDVPVDENCILMQFTGLKDKNGKEIYEGDIVRNNEAIRLSKLGMINPILEKLGIKPPEWLTIIKDIRILPFYEGQRNNEVEIIGNIYETSEIIN